ncbi:hypothetical protein [Shewanella algae]|uniref:PglD-related sugar-binding protein n=1 Tax=Shewanella algae TaxID=38313 RepID=UPI000BB5EB28|nr:hypothetical protein [Shewanella algae]
MMSDVVVYGMGGHGKVLIDLVHDSGLKILGVFDDKLKKGSVVKGYKVLGGISELIEYKVQCDNVILGIGSNNARKDVYLKLKLALFNFPVLVHSSSIISPLTVIDEGSVVLPGVVISNEVTIGTGCIVNANATIDHNSTVGSFCHIGLSSVVTSHSNVKDLDFLTHGAVLL